MSGSIFTNQSSVHHHQDTTRHPQDANVLCKIHKHKVEASENFIFPNNLQIFKREVSLHTACMASPCSKFPFPDHIVRNNLLAKRNF